MSDVSIDDLLPLFESASTAKLAMDELEHVGEDAVLAIPQLIRLAGIETSDGILKSEIKLQLLRVWTTVSLQAKKWPNLVEQRIREIEADSKEAVSAECKAEIEEELREEIKAARKEILVSVESLLQHESGEVRAEAAHAIGVLVLQARWTNVPLSIPVRLASVAAEDESAIAKLRANSALQSIRTIR